MAGSMIRGGQVSRYMNMEEEKWLHGGGVALEVSPSAADA